MFAVNCPSGRCRDCDGTTKLEARIYSNDGRFLRYGTAIECTTCDGRGYHMTAARAASIPVRQE